MRPARMLTFLIGGATLAGTGAYVIIDLYRWQWVRATITGIFFLATEIAIGFVVLAGKLAASRPADQRRQRIATHLRDAQSAPSHVFDWLKPDASRTNVFVPLLMGAGMLLSGLAWVVERLGRITAGSTTDVGVATRLATLGPPAGGFLDDGHDPLRTLRAPAGASR